MTTEEALACIEGPIAAGARRAASVEALYRQFEESPEMRKLELGIDWGKSQWLYDAAIQWSREESEGKGYAHPRDIELAIICYLLGGRVEHDVGARAILLRFSLLTAPRWGLYWASQMAGHVLALKDG